MTHRLVTERARQRGGKAMWRAAFYVLKQGALPLALLLMMLRAAAAQGEDPKLSISGYDAVGYFTDGRPEQGKPEFEYIWHKLRWRFASSEHRDLFSRDPDRYAPQYDGYCAMGVASDAAHKDTVDPNAWAIVDGKLYLVHNSYWLAQWREHAKEYIKQANANWGTVEELADPIIIGPPCAASPPSTKVAVSSGGFWLDIAAQVPRDEAGNIVGKGDMRAQMEQVGKNADACLKAGGAGVNNVLFTVNHVAAPVEFKENADLFQRYFGPPSPNSTTIPVPQLADPDYLLEVEVFAAIK